MDAAGAVVVPSSLREEGNVLIFSAEDHRPLALPARALWSTAQEGHATVLLELGVEISGWVVTPWGSPVPDVDVLGVGKYGADFDGSADSFVPGPTTEGDLAHARTDAKGAFHLRGIGTLPVRLVARKNGFVQESDAEQEPLVATTAGDGAQIVLRPMLLGGVRVVDSASGEAVTDFHVRIVESASVRTGPILGLAECDREHPGTISGLGPLDRPGEWWVSSCYADQATGLEDEGQRAVLVEAPGYEPANDVLVRSRWVGHEKASDPTLVLLVRAGPREEWGSLRVRVSTAVPLTAPLSCARIRVEPIDRTPGAGEQSGVLAWTYLVDLDAGGRSLRTIPLPRGRYRVRPAEGTGWFTWRPSAEDPWHTVDITDSAREVEVTLGFRAALVRVVVKTQAGGPVGLFDLTAHHLPPLAPGRPEGGMAPMLAVLSESVPAWWKQQGNLPYRAHLQLRPDLVEFLVPPGRISLRVQKSGFEGPMMQTLDVRPDTVGIAEFVLKPLRGGSDDR